MATIASVAERFRREIAKERDALAHKVASGNIDNVERQQGRYAGLGSALDIFDRVLQTEGGDEDGDGGKRHR